LISKIRGPYLEMLVRDYGEGIPKEAQPHIFDAFYRVDTARNRAEGGVGIGLSLAQALIKMHEGDVFVESEIGEGAIFCVRVPLRRKLGN
jgi:signal transduction histidine kinase